MTSERLEIPHPDIGGALVGILERRGPPTPAGQLRPLALILHGAMGHKDYVYQKRLAHALPLDSYRFDFRGSHESAGIFRYDGFAEDVSDIRVVVAHLTRHHGYHVTLIVGHSRGSVAGMYWLCTAPEGACVRGFVNCSARYRMEGIYVHLPEYQPSFDAQGFYEWRTAVARRPVVVIVRPEQVHAVAQWDMSVVKDAPTSTHVLTVHGLADALIPPYEALLYAHIFGGRAGTGTHDLCLLEDVDHNFTGARGAVVSAIVAWWAALDRGDLKTGVWTAESEDDALLARL